MTKYKVYSDGHLIGTYDSKEMAENVADCEFWGRCARVEVKEVLE